MAAGAEKEADPTKKKKLATSFMWVLSFFKSCLILSWCFWGKEKKKKGGKIDTAEKMKEGLNPTLKKEPAKDIVWKV